MEEESEDHDAKDENVNKQIKRKSNRNVINKAKDAMKA